MSVLVKTLTIAYMCHITVMVAVVFCYSSRKVYVIKSQQSNMFLAHFTTKQCGKFDHTVLLSTVKKTVYSGLRKHFIQVLRCFSILRKV